MPHFESTNSLLLSLLYDPVLMSILDYLKKNHSIDHLDLFGKALSLLFNRLLRFVLAFLPRRKNLLILWLQSPPAVILKVKKIKSVTASNFALSICHEMME